VHAYGFNQYQLIVKRVIMELKDFIKRVIEDVTTAVSESQKELKNGAVINPGVGITQTSKGNYYQHGVTSIDFDIAISDSSTSESGGGLTVLSLITAGMKTSDGNTELSRIKFSIPLVLPTKK
jgi:hypothetical protein